MEHGWVWYVAYGSNLCRERFQVYLAGGRVEGGARDYPGCRDTSPPRGDLPVRLPGRLRFGGRSRVWGGGMAFYDHDTPGPSAGRAYLVSAGQLADICAQEMHRRPVDGDPLDHLLQAGFAGERCTTGPGRYETLIRLGERAGHAMVTFTAADPAGLPAATPAPAYRALITTGLAQSHGWDAATAGAYLDRALAPESAVSR